MNDQLHPPRSTPTVNKPLWAAVIVLGVAALAMGAALIRIQTHPEEPRLAVLATAAPAPMVTASDAQVPVAGDAVAMHKTQAVAADQTHVAAKPLAKQVTKPICSNCGTVRAVTAVQRDGAASGGGAIAGGVLGALVGNQVGDGNGKTLATILGAVGGGVAGNTVEKSMKKVTVYEVLVRMDDGSTRSVEQATPPVVGAKVIVEGNALHADTRSSAQ
ncbi:MAG: glycine zipper 2TM domain-containing protein [Comamonadaceae bacterium]